MGAVRTSLLHGIYACTKRVAAWRRSVTESLLPAYRVAKRYLAPWLGPVKRLLIRGWILTGKWLAFCFHPVSPWFEPVRKVLYLLRLHQPGWIDRRLVALAVSDKTRLLGYAVRALESGDLRNGLNVLVNLSRIHPDVLVEHAPELRRWYSNRQQSPDQALLQRMLATLLEDQGPDDEVYLREAMRSSDEYIAFAAKCLLIDHMLDRGRDEETFEEFKLSWPLHCIDPYLAFLVSQETCQPVPSRAFSACCPYIGEVAFCGTREPLDLVAKWNDFHFAQMRLEVHRSSVTRKSGCRRCFIQGMYGSDHLIGVHNLKLENPSALQQENLAKARRHFLRGDALVQSYPVVLNISLGMSCNLRCIMCSAKWSKYSNVYDFSQEQIEAALPLLPYAGSFTFTGGEPLLYPATKFLMEYIVAHPEINDHLAIAFTTNGTLLEKSLPWLDGIKNLEIRVSLDAMGDAYQHIRGTSWEHIQRNVLAFKERCGAGDRRWKIVSSNILMKTSLPGLQEFVAWHGKHRIPSSYFRVFLEHDRLARQEDLIRYPKLLRKIPGWRDILQDSSQMLRDASDCSGAENIDHFREELEKSISEKGLRRSV